jgi:replication fork protection complex subunit Csm3/Swi3
MSDYDQALPQNHREQSKYQSPNDVDDLFDYDVGLDEVLNSINTESNKAGPDAIKESTGSGPSLGLDEEVKVSKRRHPIAKLDETR